MKFVATEDIAAPIDLVWARVADLETFEKRIAARAGGVERRPPGPVALGTQWTGRTEVMGKSRKVTMKLDRMDAPTQLGVSGGTDGMELDITAELTEMAPLRTRLVVTTEARARSLAARLMLQSAKLARKTLAQRYKGRISDFAAAIEAETGRA